MNDLATLTARAVEVCQARAEACLDGELLVEPIRASERWDPLALRWTSDHDLVVWRAFGEFEVLLDEAGVPIGFHDPDKWEGCRGEIAAAGAEALARATGLVPPSQAMVAVAPGERGALELLFAEPGGRGERLRALVNPHRRSVISILPEGDAT